MTPFNRRKSTDTTESGESVSTLEPERMNNEEVGKYFTENKCGGIFHVSDESFIFYI